MTVARRAATACLATWSSVLLIVVAGSVSGCARGAASTATASPGAGEVIRVTHPGVTPYIQSTVLEADRTIQDRELDAGRRPAELLAFLEVAPGQRFGEIGAGRGYTTELVARAVGEKGQVFAQNTRGMLERFVGKPWAERLARPSMKNVVRADRELDDPFPPEARDLDGVYIVLFYHDTVGMSADRGKMNAAVFRALRPGGSYVIVDHAARTGSGVADAQTLHRIDEALVIKEVTQAGFRLQAIGDFLRNAADKRDWNPSPSAAGERRGSSDRFVLRFVKPS